MLLIWERYILKEILKSFCLFLAIFYGLYILIDYSSHTSGANYHHTRLSIQELCTHYGCEFLVRSEILIPFAFLIASIKTLCKLNVHNEWVALLAAGFSKKRLLRPLLGFALLITALLYANLEISLPKATKKLQVLDEKYVREKPARNAKPLVHHLVLDDGSLLLFKHWNHHLKQFEETFWIRSIDEIWRISKLQPYTNPPSAEFVDILHRKEEGELTLVRTIEKEAIEGMRFNKKRLIETITPPDELALSELAKKIPSHNSLRSGKEAHLLSAFYHKLAMPWLAFLVVLGAAPFCIQFTRHLPLFFIYAGSIFGLVAMYLIMNAATVLGERQVAEPAIAIFAPFTFFAILFIFRYLRMK